MAEDVAQVPVAALGFVPEGWQAPRPEPSGGSVDADGLPGLVWVLGANNRPRPLGVWIGASDSYFSAALWGPIREGDRVIIGQTRTPRKPGWFAVR